MSSEDMSQSTRLAILYGSQTGNAEDLAKRIGIWAKYLGYRVLVQTMDDYQLKMLPKQQLVIFVCSTTGHGQEPENMKNFYTFMRRRDLPKDCLTNVKFVVYGLGDSSYAKFNYVSKILYKRLVDCGAKPLQDLVASDEQHPAGCDGIIYFKLSRLWAFLDDCDVTCNMKAAKTTDGDSYEVLLYKEGDGPLPKNIFADEFARRFNIREASCVINQRVTSQEHFQDTRFLCFKSDSELNYEPGDVCTIYPENCEENIQAFLKILNLDPHQRFKLTKKDPNYMINYLYDFIPDGTSVMDLVRYYLDIQSVPKRSFFQYLLTYCDDFIEDVKLKEFASTAGQEEMYTYCARPKRTILETLMDFPNTTKNVTLEGLFDMIPPIKPRSFSIASASSAHPNEIHLIVGVVTYKTSMRKLRRGLCSNFLARMDSSSKLRYFIRQSAFKLPEDDGVPIVMIGPGLGIAPFRGFIEERVRRCIERNDSACNMQLYFGCRHPERDFYFRDQLEGYAADGMLNLRVAFSRNEPKRYVQDLLLQDSDDIRRLIQDERAVVYVAGNSKLPEELRTLFGKLLSSQDGDQDRSVEADRLVNRLEASNKLQYDCW